MRKILGLFIAFASFMIVVPCFASLPPVTDGLVECWNLDEGNGVITIDTSSNGNNGTIVNASARTS